MKLRQDEILPFDPYFSTLVGMNQHPGNLRDNATKMTLEDCMAKAEEMIELRRKVIPNFGDIA